MHIATVYEGTVDPSNVAFGYEYGPITDPVVGTDVNLDPSTDPTIRNMTVGGVLGQRQPALSAVADGVAIPGVGVGVNLGNGDTPPGPVDPPDDPVTGDIDRFELCITDSNGNPLKNVTVKICSEQVTGPDGLVQFDLAPGTYTAEVIYNGQSKSITEFNV